MTSTHYLTRITKNSYIPYQKTKTFHTTHQKYAIRNRRSKADRSKISFFDERQKHNLNSPFNLDLKEEVTMWLFVRSTSRPSLWRTVGLGKLKISLLTSTTRLDEVEQHKEGQ